MRHIFPFACAALVAAPLAKAADYSGSVLYPLMAPSSDPYTSVSGGPQTSAAGQTVGATDGNGTTNSQQALLWSNPSGTAVQLNPTNLTGITGSQANATDGYQQVGYGIGSGTGNLFHALLWSGTADSSVDLNPTNLTGVIASQAFGIAAGQQVGAGNVANDAHALLWSGTADSAVDLNPTNLANFVTSTAYGTDGTQQVGFGELGTDTKHAHALLWSGTADSAVDLSPTTLTGINTSVALNVAGIEQVGYGNGPGTGIENHALLWFGTGASAIDLNPTNLTGFNSSEALGTNGIQQVGFGNPSQGAAGNGLQALLWFGTADSAVDLQSLLPSGGTWEDSAAYSIDSAGDIFGTADGTYQGTTGTFAIEWTAVPEPATVSLLAVGGVGSLIRRRRV